MEAYDDQYEVNDVHSSQPDFEDIFEKRTGQITSPPTGGYLPVSCNRCSMRYWESVDTDSPQRDPDDEGGAGTVVVIPLFAELVCPLCHKHEPCDEQLTGRCHGSLESFELDQDQKISSRHFKRVPNLNAVFGQETPDLMHLITVNKSVGVNKGQSSILCTPTETVIYDTGHKKYAKRVIDEVIGAESKLGGSAAHEDITVLISHPDTDHCAGVSLIAELLAVTKVMFFHPRENYVGVAQELRSIDTACNDLGVETFIDQMLEQQSLIAVDHSYWRDFLLLPARVTAQRCWQGDAVSKNNSSVCLLRCDLLECEGESRLWIGIAADRDYEDFMNQAATVEGFDGSFDILSLPHHGSHLSTPRDVQLAPADFYVVQGTPTCRLSNDKAAHLNVISLVLQMLDDNDIIVRNTYATIVFTKTLLTKEMVLDEYQHHGSFSRLTIFALSDSTVEFSMVPIPGARKVQVFPRKSEWFIRAKYDRNDYDD
jgi:beta-lactamase superfamily II metal-dependent hydrolase